MASFQTFRPDQALQWGEVGALHLPWWGKLGAFYLPWWGEVGAFHLPWWGEVGALRLRSLTVGFRGQENELAGCERLGDFTRPLVALVSILRNTLH